MARVNKYGARKRSFGGLKFASGREASRWLELQMLLKAGAISDLRAHPRYELRDYHTEIRYASGRLAVYTADSQYIEDGVLITEDVKSKATMTEASKLRIAVFESLYNRPVRLVF